MEQPQEALALAEREMVAARASGDDVALARSLLSNGANQIVAGEAGSGPDLLEEARGLLESGASYDHQQGLGWYWILQAELANAGLVEQELTRVVEAAERALEVLTPIENWPGVARAYAARADAHERMGNEGAAAEDRREQKRYEGLVGSEEGSS
jgi:hypothetical protein